MPSVRTITLGVVGGIVGTAILLALAMISLPAPNAEATKRMVDNEVVVAYGDRYCIHPKILAIMADGKTP